MISASAAGAHRFGRVRRNGYDPAEVDAVVARLVDTLSSYEERTAQLEERLAEADASADAIRRTFIAAERTRDEILEGARSQASSIQESARSEADEIVTVARARAAELTREADGEVASLRQTATTLGQEISHTRQRVLEEAQAHADEIRRRAETEASERMAHVQAEAERLSQGVHEDAGRERRRAALASRYITLGAARAHRAALMHADAVVADARRRATEIVARAERDTEAVRRRATHLRAAITTLEASARNLAAMAATEASVIDLNELEALDEAESQLAAVTRMRSPQDSSPARDTEDDESPDAPQLSVAEARAELADETDSRADDDGSSDDEEPAEPKPRTFYQRTTGIPLSERVKSARRSG